MEDSESAEKQENTGIGPASACRGKSAFAGSSPAMTTWVDTRAVSLCRALPDLLAPSERNPQLYEMATGTISLFRDCYLQ
jgi:hypothetical protein